jgi:hypothetical protein
VNLEHLRAFIWLRWRLLFHQMHRGGIANAIAVTILAVGVAATSITLAIAAFLIGLVAFEQATPIVYLFVWGGLVLVFCLSWSISLLTELQRSEGLSLEKFLHLPVSLSGVFFLNYLSSLFSVNLFMFLPMMAGLSLGLTIAQGPAMLLLFPLLAAFVLMVTGVTYQFQGWLASLMVNKRRRQTIIVLVTLFFVLIFQIPNAINLLVPWHGVKEEVEGTKKIHEDLKAALAKGDFDQAEFAKRYQEAVKQAAADRSEKNQAMWTQVESGLGFVCLALPIGWLPYGAMSLADGSIWPAPLCALAMTVLGAASLRRAYRTTVRLYTGDFTAGKKGVNAPVVAKPTGPIVAPRNWLDARLPALSEPAAAIVLGGLRSLTRAPEAKMLLLTPVMMLVFFGAAIFREPIDLPIFVRPLIAFGALAMSFFTLAQIAGNQFGFDRAGFRAFVLCPTPRRDILLGKNLAILPVSLLIGSAMMVMVEVLYPLRIDHLLALVPQWISMGLIFCLLMNLISIFAPMRVAHGSFKPTTVKVVPTLLQMSFVLLMPLALAPTLMPLGVEFGLEMLEWTDGVPIHLALSLVVCAVVIVIYRAILTWQGGLLQRREQAILELVTTKAE